MRDRRDAEVHILVTIQSGGNSREYTFNFIGLERFDGVDQRLVHASSFTDTDDERRRGIQRLLELGLVRSTFLNLDNSYRAAAAVEYNIFPYSESSEREFTIAYFVGGTRLDYEEITVFDKLSETYADQGAFIAFGMERPWGEARLDLQYSHFLDNFDRSRIEFRTDVEYHIVRGLSFDVYAGVSRIRDQIYLPKGGATDAEVLVARRQLETDLSFRGGVQLRYTFGSIYNNIVNSRLSSGSSLFSRVF